MQTIASARDFLRDQLSQGPRLASELAAAAEASRLSLRTLRRAKSELGVVSRRAGSAATDPWLWELLRGGAPDDPSSQGSEAKDELVDRVAALEERLEAAVALLMKLVAVVRHQAGSPRAN